MKNFKKTKRADLENKRGIFLRLGYIIALLFIIFAFELESVSDHSIGLQNNINQGDDIDYFVLPIPETPKPEKIQIIKTTTFEVIEDDGEEDIDPDIFDVENDPEQEAEMYVPAYSEDDDPPETLSFVIVEEKPEFPGGEAGIVQYLAKNIRYPRLAVETGIQGTVYVSFTIMEDGSISNVEISHSIGGGCDEEAKRVIQNMPHWKPGMQRGHKVRVTYQLPVKYLLH